MMNNINLIFSIGSSVVALILLIPCLVVFVECLAGLMPQGRRTRCPAPGVPRGSVAVLIPAHNEVSGIRAAIQAVLPQLHPGDRVLVVADNCQDETAAAAMEAGAEVVVRHDPQRRGKGFALERGVEYLSHDPPGVVIVLDADCWLETGSVDQLAAMAQRTRRPVQAVNRAQLPPSAGVRDQLSAFAFLFKGEVRTAGLSWLGLPCPLMGTGMAIPWSLIRIAILGSDNIVEDLKLGIDLAVAGYPASFCPHAAVVSDLPTEGTAATVQRTRWEHGSLRTMVTQIPRLTYEAVHRGRPALIGMALDLLVPPLALLVLMLIISTLLGIGTWLLGGWLIGAMVSAAAMLLLLGSIALGWAVRGRTRLSHRCLYGVFQYLVWKAGIYVRLMFNRRAGWTRTPRPGSQVSNQ